MDPLPPIVEPEQRWHRVFAWGVFAVALIVYPVLLSRYVQATSPTFDEGMHIAAGYRYWECGDYGINPEHPPLLKLIASAPLRHWPLNVYDSACGSGTTNNIRLIAIGYRLMNGPSADQILATSRRAAMLFPLLLLVVLFFAARAWFGDLAGGCAVILTVFEPNLAGHGPLITTDMAVAAMTVAAVFCADRYLRKPSTWRLLLMGFALGLALASKHTGVFVPFILLLQFAAHLWFQRGSSQPATIPRRLLAWFAACLLSVAVLWGTYQFRYSALPGHSQAFAVAKTLQNDGKADSLLGKTILGIAHLRLLPESYVAGLLYVVENSVRPSFIFGKRYDTGVWYYFPATLLIKTPLSLLLLVLLAVASPPLWRAHKREFVVLGIPIVVFLLSAVCSKINLGVRHILPIYPFLILLGASGAAHYARRSRITAILCGALLLSQVVSYAHSYPNLIAYANEAWGGQKKLHRFLGDSNVDWGQSLYQVRDYAAAHGITGCSIAWFGARKPSLAGLSCRMLAGPGYVESGETELPPILPEKFSGTVFVSNTLVDYDLYPYRYFLDHPPDDVIAGSVLVYHGDFDLPEIAAERRASRGWWYLNHQQGTQAVEEFAAAEPHVVARGNVLSLYGWALEVAGRPREAREKYEQAADDFAGKPADAQWRKAALERVAALQHTEGSPSNTK
jgi:Dolichyl-phosphate-mannose-protein mannosyltransferase